MKQTQIYVIRETMNYGHDPKFVCAILNSPRFQILQFSLSLSSHHLSLSLSLSPLSLRLSQSLSRLPVLRSVSLSLFSLLSFSSLSLSLSLSQIGIRLNWKLMKQNTTLVKNKYTNMYLKYIYAMLSILQINLHMYT